VCEPDTPFASTGHDTSTGPEKNTNQRKLGDAILKENAH
jgi:hypothetical protein